MDLNRLNLRRRFDELTPMAAAAEARPLNFNTSGKASGHLNSTRDRSSLTVAASDQTVHNASAEATEISIGTEEISSKDIDTESEGKY